jgi:hypothetical protein
MRAMEVWVAPVMASTRFVGGGIGGGADDDAVAPGIVPVDLQALELVGEPGFFDAGAEAGGFLLVEELDVQDGLEVGGRTTTPSMRSQKPMPPNSKPRLSCPGAVRR